MDTLTDDWIYPLTWGWSLPRLKEKWQNKLYYHNNFGLLLNSIWVKPFPGDCGALTVQNIGCAKKEDIKDVMELASDNGFSKLFGTVVKRMASKQCEETKKLFKDLGWILVSEGKSNRNSDKTDLVFVYVNHDCTHKGY